MDFNDNFNDDDFDDENATPKRGGPDNEPSEQPESEAEPNAEPHPEALPALMTFDCLNDLEDWLETLDYASFWKAIAPHAVQLPTREEADKMVAGGRIDEETMLVSLRGLAERQISLRYNLQWKDRTPFLYAH